MYSDFLEINKNFQSSINLELDFGNEAKIDEYIPTTDICDVLRKFTYAVLNRNNNKATTLIGPYGKGKSFLLLILSFLFGNNKNTEAWARLVKKISLIDEELASSLLELKEKKINLFPIIINSNYDNITQSFQIALNDALKREGLTELIPNSIFDVCLTIIERWEANNEVSESIFKKCIEVNKISLQSIKKGLKEFSSDAYKKFEKLYNCINIGLEFNPLVSTDIVKTYSDIASQLSKFGYSGLFIVFDEFSKFLENNSSNMIKDLKIVQDFAELAARSDKDAQIHLCCVAHKSLSLYKPEKKSGLSIDSFKTIEGRFKEIRFNRSLEENYQIISAAIIKKPEAKEFIDGYIKGHEDFYNGIKELSLFDKEINHEDLFYGCFPLNPLTVYSLVRISEYAAQNERTLFTFISDTDDDSLNSFIHSHDKGLFDVDKIYDYFYSTFKKEETNSIRNIWYRAESILSKIDDFNQKKIIKAISIILMINDFDVLPPDETVLALACELSPLETRKIIETLIDKRFLRKNILNNLLSFALSNTKQIDELVEINKKSKFKNINYSDVLDSINPKKFLLPRKYNEENKITRFFKIIFMDEKKFMDLKSLNYFFEQNYCDGLVIYLLKDKLTASKINGKIAELNNPRLIVTVPRGQIEPEFYSLILNYACLNEVRQQKGIDEITANEIQLLLDETNSDIDKLVEQYFIQESANYSLFNKQEQPINILASEIMDRVYRVHLIFNNELINKRDVTTQYQKAINHVIDWLLDGEKEFNFSPTSPESSIKIAVLDNNNRGDITSKNFRNVIDKLKTRIISTNGEKKALTDLIKDFSLPPYGIRQGVLPVLVAKAISELSDNVILYFKTKEIEMRSDNLVKAILNESYLISCSKGSDKQKEYLDKMMKLFDVKSTNNFRKDTFLLAAKIKQFFIGLPQVIRLCNLGNNFLDLEEDFLSLKTNFLAFDINPYDSIFDAPLKSGFFKDYERVFEGLEYYKKNANSLIYPYKNRLVSLIRKEFDIDENSSLKTGFTEVLNKTLGKDVQPILEAKQKSIYNLVSLQFSYDDFEALNKLAKISVGQFIEDWDSDKSQVLIKELHIFKEQLISSSKVTVKNNMLDLSNYSKQKVSDMAVLLRNNMESVLDEFSDSVTPEDKVAVLSSLLEKLL